MMYLKHLRVLFKGHYIRKNPWLKKYYVELEDFQLTDGFNTLEEAQAFIERNFK